MAHQTLMDHAMHIDHSMLASLTFTCILFSFIYSWRISVNNLDKITHANTFFQVDIKQQINWFDTLIDIVLNLTIFSSVKFLYIYPKDFGAISNEPPTFKFFVFFFYSSFAMWEQSLFFNTSPHVQLTTKFVRNHLRHKLVIRSFDDVLIQFET